MQITSVMCLKRDSEYLRPSTEQSICKNKLAMRAEQNERYEERFRNKENLCQI